jgi:molecular chaperone Hsp33
MLDNPHTNRPTLDLLDAPDTLARCLVADAQVRTVAVNLQNTWREIVGKQPLPQPVQQLLGELCAAAPLLAATLKLDGALVLQLQGDAGSCVRLIVVEYTANHTLRAAVKLNDAVDREALFTHETVQPSEVGLQTLVSAQGSGRFIVVLDPTHKLPGQKPYTSLVPIVGNSVAHSIDYYMASSEQLPTRVLLTSDDHACAGLLIQRMPLSGGKAAPDTRAMTYNEHGHEILAHEAHDDTWLRMRHLLNTVKNAEMLITSPVTMLRRLFWQEEPSAADSQALRFYCGCSRQKVQSMLKMLGADEVNSIVAEQGCVTVSCDYCEASYGFDAVDCAAILASAVSSDTGGVQ